MLHFLRAGKKAVCICVQERWILGIFILRFSLQNTDISSTVDHKRETTSSYFLSLFQIFKAYKQFVSFWTSSNLCSIESINDYSTSIFFSEFVKPLKFTDKDSQSSKQDWTVQRQLERRFENRSQFLLYGCVFFLLAKILCGSLQNNKRN